MIKKFAKSLAKLLRGCAKSLRSMVVYCYFDAVCTHFIIKGLVICNMPNECEIIRYNKFSNLLILNVLVTESVLNIQTSISSICFERNQCFSINFQLLFIVLFIREIQGVVD